MYVVTKNAAIPYVVFFEQAFFYIMIDSGPIVGVGCPPWVILWVQVLQLWAAGDWVPSLLADVSDVRCHDHLGSFCSLPFPSRV